MADDREFDSRAAAELAALQNTEDAAQRLARIRAMSDATLVRCYSLLSDTRIIVNVPSLSLLEEEIKARGLPLGSSH